MSRLFLAFLCFLRILFGKKLPPEAMKFLPETTTPAPELLPAEKPADKALLPPAATRPAPEVKPEPARPAPATEERPRVSAAQQHRDGALAFLALLQREGRLVDFPLERPHRLVDEPSWQHPTRRRGVSRCPYTWAWPPLGTAVTARRDGGRAGWWSAELDTPTPGFQGQISHAAVNCKNNA